MEKKLAVIVDKNEVTTEVADTEMCSSACDVAMETCSSESHGACGDGLSAVKKRQINNIKALKLRDSYALVHYPEPPGISFFIVFVSSAVVCL